VRPFAGSNLKNIQEGKAQKKAIKQAAAAEVSDPQLLTQVGPLLHIRGIITVNYYCSCPGKLGI
jgi:hypothetical protein